MNKRIRVIFAKRYTVIIYMARNYLYELWRFFFFFFFPDTIYMVLITLNNFIYHPFILLPSIKIYVDWFFNLKTNLYTNMLWRIAPHRLREIVGELVDVV
jgi:hypothetical protein